MHFACLKKNAFFALGIRTKFSNLSESEITRKKREVGVEVGKLPSKVSTLERYLHKGTVTDCFPSSSKVPSRLRTFLEPSTLPLRKMPTKTF